jgi:hypothetical protein
MRKVNENLWHALSHGQACKASANTRCDMAGNVWLFDHLIARLANPQGSVHALSNWEFNLQGYHTPTTLDRLNAIIWNAADTPFVRVASRIAILKGCAYRGGKTELKVPKGVDPQAHWELFYDPARPPLEWLPVSGWFPARLERT